MASITYNGQNSDSFGLELVNAIEHELSGYDVEPIPVPGRDGVLLKSNKRLKPVERAYPFVLKPESTVYDSTDDLIEWLGVEGWHDLELSWDSDYIYRATCINQISIDEVVKQFGKLRVAFLVHPIKYLKLGKEAKSISKGQNVVNRGNVPAKPKIELTGYGDTTIAINGRFLPLRDVQGNIAIDMESFMVESGNLSAWRNVRREEGSEFPKLDVGNNTINWTGDFTMKITTNEGVRI